MVIGLGVLAALGYALFRVLRWLLRLIVSPFRARPLAAGLGSEYEQMVRGTAKIVLPQQRRVRQPEKEARLPFPPRTQGDAAPETPAAQTTPTPQPRHAVEPKGMQRLKHTFLPAWLAMPLVFLGSVFLLFKPIGGSWTLYGSALFVAVAAALWTAKRYKLVVLHRSNRGTVLWVRWGSTAKQSIEPPSVSFNGTDLAASEVPTGVRHP